MGLATTFVITLACGATWMLDNWLLMPLGLGYLRILTFILVIAAVVQFTEMVVKKSQPRPLPGAGHLPAADHHQLRGARRGAAQCPGEDAASCTSLLYGFGSALGFTLVLLIFAGLRERLALARVPAAFAGAPIALHHSPACCRWPSWASAGLNVSREIHMIVAILSLTLLGAALGFGLGIAARSSAGRGQPAGRRTRGAMMPGSQLRPVRLSRLRRRGGGHRRRHARRSPVCPPGGKALASGARGQAGHRRSTCPAVADDGPKIAMVAEEICIGCCRCSQGLPDRRHRRRRQADP